MFFSYLAFRVISPTNCNVLIAGAIRFWQNFLLNFLNFCFRIGACDDSEVSFFARLLKRNGLNCNRHVKVAIYSTIYRVPLARKSPLKLHVAFACNRLPRLQFCMWRVWLCFHTSVNAEDWTQTPRWVKKKIYHIFNSSSLINFRVWEWTFLMLFRPPLCRDDLCVTL